MSNSAKMRKMKQRDIIRVIAKRMMAVKRREKL
jgi:hypothetical protein